tara:strand:- start:968 stop:1306 length:339 start_codon:yes stop_codon:yes gene_type:complete
MKMLTLNKNPIFKVRKELTREELQQGWKEFYFLAKDFHSKYKNKHGYKRALAGEFDGKGELFALIDPNDFKKYQDVTLHFLGSKLEEVAQCKIQGETKHVVHASGYWNCIGS